MKSSRLSAKSTISSNSSRSALRMPRIEPFEVDVLAPGELGVEAGTDLQQRADSPRIPQAPSVGSVMRERIFSSVLLPAPLRPITPTTSPALDLEGHVHERPKRVIIAARGISIAMYQRPGGAGRPQQCICQGVPERSVALTSGAYAVAFAEAFYPYGNFRHGGLRSNQRRFREASRRAGWSSSHGWAGTAE